MNLRYSFTLVLYRERSHDIMSLKFHIKYALWQILLGCTMEKDRPRG